MVHLKSSWSKWNTIEYNKGGQIIVFTSGKILQSILCKKKSKTIGKQ